MSLFVDLHGAAFHTAAQHSTNLLATASSGQQIASDGGGGSGFSPILVVVGVIGVLLLLTFLGRPEATVVVVQQPAGSFVSVFGLLVIGAAILIIVVHLMSGSG